MKTYTWDSYKPLTFPEWRDSNGYTDEWCERQGIGQNTLFNTKKIDISYEKYKSKFYREHYRVNEKHSDIQNFNIIANLLAENGALKKQIKAQQPTPENKLYAIIADLKANNEILKNPVHKRLKTV